MFQGTFLLDDSEYKQFSAVKKKIDREMIGEYFVNTRAREAGAMTSDKRFVSHPQRLNTDSDEMSSNDSLRKSTEITSKQEVEFIYHEQVRNKIHIQM